MVSIKRWSVVFGICKKLHHGLVLFFRKITKNERKWRLRAVAVWEKKSFKANIVHPIFSKY